MSPEAGPATNGNNEPNELLSSLLAEPPKLLKHIYDWSKVLGLISTVAGAVGAVFLGMANGFLLGFFAAATFVVSCLFLRLAVSSTATVDLVIRQLVTDLYTNKAERESAARSLARTRQRVSYVLAALTAFALVSCAILLVPPLVHMTMTKRPERVQFESLDYFSPRRHAELLRSSPMLEAVYTHLKDEGQAAHQNSDVAIGFTIPFDHPVPEFRCFMSLDSPDYEITGYALLLTKKGNRAVYEDLRVSYEKAVSVTFTVPASESGDQILVVCRVSVPVGRPLPRDLRNQITLLLIP